MIVITSKWTILRGPLSTNTNSRILKIHSVVVTLKAIPAEAFAHPKTHGLTNDIIKSSKVTNNKRPSSLHSRTMLSTYFLHF